jgi:hypothetical protein
MDPETLCLNCKTLVDFESKHHGKRWGEWICHFRQYPPQPKHSAADVDWEIYGPDGTWRKTYQGVTAIVVPVSGEIFLEDGMNGWQTPHETWAVYFTRDHKTLTFSGKVYEKLGTAKSAAANKLSQRTTKV